MSALPPSAAVLRLRPLAEAPTDAELVERARAGSRPAQAELYERHAEAVLGRAGRLLGRRSDAQDVAQDAFMSAFRDLAALADGQAFGSWVRQIAVRLVHRRFRRRRMLERLGLARVDTDLTLSALATGAPPDTVVLLGQIDGALARLPVEERLAWMLRYVEGCELSEVARDLGCSLATAKRRIAAAQRRVHEFVHVDLGGSEE
jgi:RNA polymerase sigma-70 factor (ECF subfamily)